MTSNRIHVKCSLNTLVKIRKPGVRYLSKALWFKFSKLNCLCRGHKSSTKSSSQVVEAAWNPVIVLDRNITQVTVRVGLLKTPKFVTLPLNHRNESRNNIFHQQHSTLTLCFVSLPTLTGKYNLGSIIPYIYIYPNQPESFPLLILILLIYTSYTLSASPLQFSTVRAIQPAMGLDFTNRGATSDLFWWHIHWDM